MSVGILNPTGALALLAVGALVVLYLFDRRRRVIPVATLFLWRQIPAGALEPLATPTNLAPALELALGEVGARPETQVVVLTDLPREASGVEAERAARLDWVQIGRTDDNVAVAGLAIEEAPFQAVRDASATVLVRNYGHTERRVTLDATVGDVP